jgi:hypothetical protein
MRREDGFLVIELMKRWSSKTKRPRVSHEVHKRKEVRVRAN